MRKKLNQSPSFLSLLPNLAAKDRRGGTPPGALSARFIQRSASPPSALPGARGHLLGVGAVPEDGVAVGHHFGAGLLAEYAHQQQQAEEEDHFHVQHHYKTSYSSSASAGSGRVGRAWSGTGDEPQSHVAVRSRCSFMKCCRWMGVGVWGGGTCSFSGTVEGTLVQGDSDGK